MPEAEQLIHRTALKDKPFTPSGPLTWLVFGDDWGAHPSTTQHLVANLPVHDQIVWIDSIGVRSPDFNWRDLTRLVKKVWQMVRPGQTASAERSPGLRPDVHRVSPRVGPYHLNRSIRAFNRRILLRQVDSVLAHCARPLVVLTSNPAAIWYLPKSYDVLAYLRLDDYGRMPGYDSRLVEQSEAELYRRCDLVAYTAEALQPRIDAPCRRLYVPQGVDLQHFGRVPLTPPLGKTLGFFGILAEWLDYELIIDVARAAPDWTFEFVGPAKYVPKQIRTAPNIRLRPPEPYQKLPEIMKKWNAAWVPFRVNELTRGVNPLKLREYLAAGLPTLTTPLPEAELLVPSVYIVRTVADVLQTLETVSVSDAPGKRKERRDAVACDGWERRSDVLRAAACNVMLQQRA